jgi:hypothetical protein
VGSTDPLWFPYTEKSYGWFKKGMKVMFGGGGILKKISELF